MGGGPASQRFVARHSSADVRSPASARQADGERRDGVATLGKPFLLSGGRKEVSQVEAQEATTFTRQARCAPEGCLPSADWQLRQPVERCRG